MKRIKCIFSQAPSLFTAGGIYEMKTLKRCGMMFNEVIADNGFNITLVPGDNDAYVSAFSGHKLLADFQGVD